MIKPITFKIKVVMILNFVSVSIDTPTSSLKKMFAQNQVGREIDSHKISENARQCISNIVTLIVTLFIQN